MARFRIEQRYFKSVDHEKPGKKQKKNQFQIKALLGHFERNPVWDYATKIAICEELGMTVAQV